MGKSFQNAIHDFDLFLTRQVCLRHYEHEFMELACQCPVVVCCRCSPQQKADIVKLLKKHTGKRTCAIGEMSRTSSRSPSCSACSLASVRIWHTVHLVRLSRKREIFFSFFCNHSSSFSHLMTWGNNTVKHITLPLLHGKGFVLFPHWWKMRYYTLNVWSLGKLLSFVFPRVLMLVSRDEVEGNIRTQGKTKLSSFPRDHT